MKQTQLKEVSTTERTQEVKCKEVSFGSQSGKAADTTDDHSKVKKKAQLKRTPRAKVEKVSTETHSENDRMQLMTH